MKTAIKYQGSRVIAELCGELDHHSAGAAAAEITETVYAMLPRELVLELSRLSFMDSSGIALIIRLRRALGEYGGRLYIQNPQRQPYKVMEAAGIFKLVDIRSGGEVTT